MQYYQALYLGFPGHFCRVIFVNDATYLVIEADSTRRLVVVIFFGISASVQVTFYELVY